VGPAPRTQRSRWWAVVPNALSLLRVALGVAFPLIPGPWRLLVVLIAGVSDVLDGAASRLLRAASHTGRMLDPLADKAFALGVVCTLIYENSLAIWEVALLGLRDIAVTVGVVWLMVERNWAGLRRLPPTWLGKVTTFAQFVYILVLLQWQYQHWSLLAITAILSGLAAIQYSWLFLKRRRAVLRTAAKPGFPCA
jgi:phosphatidylglycerophosphate synthase